MAVTGVSAILFRGAIPGGSGLPVAFVGVVGRFITGGGVALDSIGGGCTTGEAAGSEEDDE